MHIKFIMVYITFLNTCRLVKKEKDTVHAFRHLPGSVLENTLESKCRKAVRVLR